MMLFNLRMTLVFYPNLNAMKIFYKKWKKILKQTDKYLTENQLTLNADKTEMLFFTNKTNSHPYFASLRFKPKNSSCMSLSWSTN